MRIKYELVTDGLLWSVKRTKHSFFIFKSETFLSHLGYWRSKNNEYFMVSCWHSKEDAEFYYKRLIS